MAAAPWRPGPEPGPGGAESEALLAPCWAARGGGPPSTPHPPLPSLFPVPFTVPEPNLFLFLCTKIQHPFIIELVHISRRGWKTAATRTRMRAACACARACVECVCARVRSDHHRAGTCTQREYPKSLLPRALRKNTTIHFIHNIII